MSKTAIVFTDLERGFLEDILYDPVSGKLFWKTSSKGRQAGSEIGTFDNGGYLVFQYKYKQYKTHRVAWFLHNKVWPSQIDHINKDRSDNRLMNLRDTTTSVNQHNRSMPLPSSGVVGAHYSKKRKNWVASIRLEGKSVFLGSFNCPTAASLAYLKEKERVLNV
jgi:hypothetical protein